MSFLLESLGQYKCNQTSAASIVITIKHTRSSNHSFFNVKPPSSSLSPKKLNSHQSFGDVFRVDISYSHRVMICRRVSFVLMALCLPPVTTRQNARSRAATRGAWVLGCGWDGSRTSLSACLLWGLSNTRTFSAASCHHSWVWCCGLSSYPLSTHVLPNIIYHNLYYLISALEICRVVVSTNIICKCESCNELYSQKKHVWLGKSCD